MMIHQPKRLIHNRGSLPTSPTKPGDNKLHTSVPILLLYALVLIAAIAAVGSTAVLTTDLYNQQSLDSMTRFYLRSVVDRLCTFTRHSLTGYEEGVRRLARLIRQDDVLWDSIPSLHLAMLQIQASYDYKITDIYFGDELKNFTDIYVMNNILSFTSTLGAHGNCTHMTQANPWILTYNISSLYPDPYTPNECMMELYDPTVRPWYVAAKTDGNQQFNVIWTEPYVFTAAVGSMAEIGITVAIPSYSRDGVFRGVSAVDVVFSDIQKMLQSYELPEDTVLAVVEKKSGYLIGANVANVHPVATPANEMLRVAQWTERRVADLSSRVGFGWEGIARMSLGDQAYYYGQASITSANTLEWVVLILLPESSITEAIVRGRTMVIVLMCAICVGTLVLFLLGGWGSMIRPLSRVCDRLQDLYSTDKSNKARTDPFQAHSYVSEIRRLEETVSTMLSLMSLVEFQQETISTLKSATRDVTYAPKDSDTNIVLIFTDIEKSTSLWGTYPQLMPDAIDQHHNILRMTAQRYKLYEVKTIGDSFMLATHDVGSAVHFAADVQLELWSAQWPSDINEFYDEMSESSGDDKVWNGLRVRIGMHMGLCEVVFDQVTKGYDYYGPVVNVAARIEDAAHGGQILMSKELWETANTMLFLSLDVSGPEHNPNFFAVELRGVERPIDLIQVMPQELKGRKFPELRSGGDKSVVCSQSQNMGVIDDSGNSTVSEHVILPHASDAKQPNEPLVRFEASNRAFLTSATLTTASDDVARLQEAFHSYFSAVSESQIVSCIQLLCSRWHVTFDEDEPFESLHKVSAKIVAGKRATTNNRSQVMLASMT